MTCLDVTYRFRGQLAAAVLRRLADLRGYYGIVQLHLNEAENQLRVEYDASRLKETDVQHLLRLTGVDITEKVELEPAA